MSINLLGTETLHELFKRLSQQNPNPTTELVYETNYQLLVSILLSARCTDKQVNKVTEKLFKMHPCPSDIAALSVERLAECINSLGLYKTKAKHVLALSHILLDKYHGQVPRKRVLLEELPGIGRKSANVFLNIAHGAPYIGIDTHVFRVSQRLGIAHNSNLLRLEEELHTNIPTDYHRYAASWLVLHGRYVCKSRNPHCQKCMLSDLCTYYNERQNSTAIG